VKTRVSKEIIVTKRIVAMSLSFIGTVFIMAMVYDILPNNVSLFGGAIFFMLSGLTWSVYPDKNAKEHGE
jgi:hypothetical protein